MPYIIGIVSALAISVYATALQLDRDRAFYPTVLNVIALLYILFAAIGGASGRVFVIEALIGGVFIVAASVGFRGSLWLVAAGLAAHGIQDFFHGSIVANPGVPVWWPAFCGGLRRGRRGLPRVAPDERFGPARVGRNGWVRRLNPCRLEWNGSRRTARIARAQPDMNPFSVQAI